MRAGLSRVEWPTDWIFRSSQISCIWRATAKAVSSAEPAPGLDGQKIGKLKLADRLQRLGSGALLQTSRLRKNPRKIVSFGGLMTMERAFVRHFLDFCCAGGPESCRATDSWRNYTAAASSLGIRTTLYAAAAKVNTHPTSAVPR